MRNIKIVSEREKTTQEKKKEKHRKLQTRMIDDHRIYHHMYE